MALVLTCAELSRAITMAGAIKAVRNALRERAEGTAHALVRQSLPLGEGRLVLTPGSLADLGAGGLRVYTAGTAAESQLTCVWDAWGALDGLIVGPSLGVLRTGALGGVAAQVLAPEAVTKVAVVGIGTHGAAQLRALCAVRQVEWVEVYRRDRDARVAAAAELRDELSVPVTPATSAEVAVRGADVVIVATTSSEPVVQAEWVARGAHVTSVGPKAQGRCELDPALFEAATRIVSDAPEQCRGEGAFVLQGTPHLERLEDLATLYAAPPARGQHDLSLYLSHGLAGTEVAVAAAALAVARERGLGAVLPGTDEAR